MATNKYYTKFQNEIDAYIKARDDHYNAESDLRDAIIETFGELRDRKDIAGLRELSKAMPAAILRAFIQYAINEIKGVSSER